MQWMRWTMPAIAVMSAAAPAYATQYMTVAEAQKRAFPNAQLAEVQAGRVWKAEAGGRPIGYFFFDHVIGKHLNIDYSVALGPDGRVHRVDILEYRESYGGEVRDAAWLGQFAGKGPQGALDVRTISGATLSSTHITEGVKRVLAYYESHLK
jgi:hypothetical protein